MTVTIRRPIEKDALNNTPETTSEKHSHTHAPLKSFIATPRADASLMERFQSLFKSTLKPGQYITKGSDGLRYMFLITSNSYQDRDKETISSDALKAYEASCYPGDGLFHCDNPLLWWHDDDVPMGEIVAVNYSEPFLVEVAKELPTRTARILWDYAEVNGDAAGTSHRFGYRDEDRQADGTFNHIFKQESSYLPERSLAANLMTYAGVIDKHMSTAQSDARLNEIFAEASGGKIKDAAAKIHAKSGALEKELAALGISHKAKGENPAAADQEAEAVDDAVASVEDTPEEKKDEAMDLSAVRGYLGKIDRIIGLIDELVAAQAGMMGDVDAGMDATAALAKEVKALKDEKVAAKAYTDSLENRVALLEGKLKLSQRRASQDTETDPEQVKKSIDDAVKTMQDAELVDSMFGKIKPAPNY